MLDEKEWSKINNILLELYSVHGAAALSEKILEKVGEEVPFSGGFFAILGSGGQPCPGESAFRGFGKNLASEIIGLISLSGSEFFMCPGSGAFSDSPLFFDFLKPCPCGGDKDGASYEDRGEKLRVLFLAGKRDAEETARFCAAVPVFCGEKLSGLLLLCRSGAFHDFSCREKYVLDIFMKHISNMARNAIASGSAEFPEARCFENAVSDFSLSHREAEILRLIADGKSNAEICDGLCVSISTVKKHVYNIFNKAGVNSRTQLLNQIYRMRKGS